MKRLLAILVLVCLLAGCSEENAYIPTGGGFQDGSSPTSQSATQVTGEVRLAYDKDESLYPYTASDRNNRALLSLIYQGLFAVNEDYEATYKQLLIDAIKQHADADKIVMLHLTHWVRGCEMLLNIQENNATFITHLQTTEADLWKLVESKQRNCIRKGEKSGVDVLALQGEEALGYLSDFQRLRQRTQQHAIKKHAQASMLLKSDQYFTELFRNPQATLFVGKVEEQVAAVALMLQSGNSVYYYSGGSDYELNKKYCCSAFVIWKSLLHYNNLGLTIFDMGGVPVQPTKDHPAYGVYAFKRSFGGTYQEFDAGEITISPWKYRVLQFLLSQRKLLRFLSDKL